MDNSVMLDYLAVTIKGLAPDDVIEKILILPKDKFVLNEWGINKYQRHYAFSEIKVYFNKDWESKMGVFIELRGQGCRQYEEYMESNVNNWVTLMKRISECHSNFTRLDIANDIFDDSLSVPLIYSYCKKQLCISTAKTFDYHEKSILENGEKVGEMVTIGVRGTQQWCIYNKLLEQKLDKDLPEMPSSWTRAELRCWQEKANLLAQQIKKGRPLKEIYFEAINGHYRFVSPRDKDSNRWRRKNVKWWNDYLETQKKTVLSVKRTKATLKRSELWTEKQVSRTLGKLYVAKAESYGQEKANGYIQHLLEIGISKLTETDETDIQQYKQEQQSSAYWGIGKDDL